MLKSGRGSLGRIVDAVRPLDATVRPHIGFEVLVDARHVGGEGLGSRYENKTSSKNQKTE
jgi:hypothetical protein